MFRRRSLSPPVPETLQDFGQARESLATLLEDCEATALEVYRSGGLPTRPGQYQKSPRARRWTFVAETLTPGEKWALLERQPLEQGWRYGDLAMIGLQSPQEEIRLAAEILQICRRLGRTLEGGTVSLENIIDAIQLGRSAERLASRDKKTTPRPSRRKT